MSLRVSHAARRRRELTTVAWLCAAAAVVACGGPSAPGPPGTPTAPSAPSTPVNLSAPTVVLGRPTDTSIVAVVKIDADVELYAEYGLSSGVYGSESPRVATATSGPVTLTMSGLKADTQYYYRIRYRARTEATYRADTEHVFHTARLSGSRFTFVIQADPHMDANSSAAVYSQTLANELADRPDFLVDLGDTAMVEKCVINASAHCAPPSPTSEATVSARYALMRGYFEQVAHSVPLFMVLGNHDGETGWPDPAQSSLNTWAARARTQWFANPVPDAFYSANPEQVPGIGFRQNYYAFEWGDALVVVLDPYGYTMSKPGSNGWGWTLGAAQYQWFARTLAASRARFKFVFAHHLLGGSGNDTRGGAAFARYFEWGGRNLDGSWAFGTQRPGWAAPIHQLMLDHKVSAWFHGHDHLYAREQLDGIVYQEVPQPSLGRYDTPNPGGGYGYLGTDGVNIFPSSGHLRVTVTASQAVVDYVRSVAPADETATRRNGAIVTSYVIQ